MDKFEICSRAMVMVGAAPITGFNGQSAEETTAETLYEGVVTGIVSKYRWRCMTGQFQLSRDSVEPQARWTAAYQLPTETQVINAVTVMDKTIEFDRYRQKILCDAAADETVIADITYRADEAFWPGYFQNVVVHKLAATFAIPIAEDTQKASYYEAQFLREFAVAKTNDAQGRTATKMPVGGLRRYHGGRP